jgi:hypothetical protein
MGACGTTAVLLTAAVVPSECSPIVADAILAAGAGLGVFVSFIATVGPGLEFETAFRNVSAPGLIQPYGLRSGPIGGHGRSPHRDGLPVKYKLFEIV